MDDGVQRALRFDPNASEWFDVWGQQQQKGWLGLPQWARPRWVTVYAGDGDDAPLVAPTGSRPPEAALCEQEGALPLGEGSLLTCRKLVLRVVGDMLLVTQADSAFAFRRSRVTFLSVSSCGYAAPSGCGPAATALLACKTRATRRIPPVL
eukprot:TRINITY_DN726_c0_g1_i2.p5 TRINITY_DN726_c0_g1~~TRINITY_DN726_c0_g1_i2.p5  ORF type:complete len:151 (-),score=44.73 TRINITY_DN726_c0_g1_i2:41-493(-)